MIRVRVLLAALAFCGFAHGADLGEARRLVEAQRYAEAIAVYDALLVDRAADADLLIETARVNAWADRHAVAARRYQQAITVAPHRRGDVVLALAWQLAWDGRHAEAIPFFREAAERPAQRTEAHYGLAEAQAARGELVDALATYDAIVTDTGELRAQLGAARMLRWMDRHDEAVVRYRAIGAAHPKAQEAWLGLARSLNFSGRHFAAIAAYDTVVRQDATLAHDTRIERATALGWAGLDDFALATLGDAADADAITLRKRLVRNTANALHAEYESAHDSDDLDVHAARVGWQQQFGTGRTLDVSARTVRVEQHATRIDGRQLLLRAGTRFGTPGSGLVWPSVSVGVRDYDGWQDTAWKVQAKWLPADLWRVDFEAGNEVVENIASLGNQVKLDAFSLGADWQFAPRWRATIAGAVLHFDDGNRRTRLLARVEHVLRGAQPRLAVGVEAMGFDDSKPEIDRGYYNPERYREGKFFGRLEHEAGGWLLETRLALGQLNETPGDASGLYAWEVSAARDLTPTLRLRFYAGGSDSGAFLATGSGYNREYMGVSLSAFF
jgi:tetratricopeptide (TPR) repeat protein